MISEECSPTCTDRGQQREDVMDAGAPRSEGSGQAVAQHMGVWILKINDYLSDLRQQRDAETQSAEDGCIGRINYGSQSGGVPI